MKYVSFTWLRLEVSLPILNDFFLLKAIFEKELIKKGDCYECRIVSFIKMSVLQRFVR